MVVIWLPLPGALSSRDDMVAQVVKEEVFGSVRGVDEKKRKRTWFPFLKRCYKPRFFMRVMHR